VLHGSAGAFSGRDPSTAASREEWAAAWDADRDAVARTGRHLDTIMWSDDGAVGMRGWYY